MTRKQGIIIIPVFNDEYKVIVCWGSDKYIKRIATKWKHDVSRFNGVRDVCRGVTIVTYRCHPIIALPKYPRTADEIGTLAHEAFHAMLDIYDTIGEEVKFPCEPFAHSISAIVKTALNKQPKK